MTLNALISKSIPAGFSAAALLLVLCAFVPAGAAAGLEEKMKYERSLEQKVEEVLGNLLGPGKSRVMIRALLDFSAKESVQMQSEATQGKDFAWGDINKASAPSELLPGFPDSSGRAQPVNGKYEREVVYPQAMVKRLTVSLVLSESIPEDQARAAQKVVQDLLAMDIARGDELLLMRARFAPLWYNSETIGVLLKYGLIGAIAIVAMTIVSIGFLKMASALRGLEAEGPGTNIRMEMAAEAGAGASLPELAAPQALAGQPAKSPQPAEPDPGQGVVFNVREDKLEILVRMLSKDSPADIAIIAAHLPQRVRPKFISMLPPAAAAAVVASLAKVRFLDPETIAQIKDDLEHQLEGAVGGYGKAVELIERAGFRAQKAMLGELQRTDPEVAAEVRRRILLLEDVERFSDKDFERLALAVPLEIWAVVSSEVSKPTMERLKRVLPERSYKMLAEIVSFGRPGDDRVAEAVTQLTAAAMRLISEGLIVRPAVQAALPGPQLKNPA